MRRLRYAVLVLLVALAAALSGCSGSKSQTIQSDGEDSQVSDPSGGMFNSSGNSVFDDSASSGEFTLDDVPEYSGKPYIEINDNVPTFTDDEITDESFESYSSLDYLDRCGTAFACLSKDTMPAAGEERGDIHEIYPSGWNQNFYDFVDQEALYNRCHLIAWKLSAENANEKNLITGTRSMNTEGMGPFEDEVASYIRHTGNHVMYRVTPVFDGQNLVASGVHMEGYSVEDDGEGISFNVYCYNVEPGVNINYANGSNYEETDTAA